MINTGKTYYKSPDTWRDQVIYFLLPDRFSDGRDLGQRPLFDRNNPGQYQAPIGNWMAAGKKFEGGTIQGIISKLDYLRRLGVTALWIGPIWQQRDETFKINIMGINHEYQSYHGYHIQNFLNVDPHFGGIDDLAELVAQAHSKGMYVIFDIIYNHTGNNWFYDGGKEAEVYQYPNPHDFGGWRAKNGDILHQKPTKLEDGVWPEEFQEAGHYTRAGSIGKNGWDEPFNGNMLHSDCQFRRGDIFDLKDLNFNTAGEEVLNEVIRIYQYWIARTDCDGFRIDTVKHVPWEVSRKFCGAIHEYAESIGKENFLLLGEVTGRDQMVKDYLELFGRNIDAALDIGLPSRRLEDVVKGFAPPQDFFNQFLGHNLLGTHREIGRYHVNVLDDHDQVDRGEGHGKNRFSALNNCPYRYEQVAHAVGMQLTTLGIPCIYYGTEQAFDGTEERHQWSIEPYDESKPFDDRYIRETMFGGGFGAFQTQGCHFFDTDHPSYIRIAAIAAIRKRQDKVGMALRRGRQYFRETAPTNNFSYPATPGELIAWSRIFVDKEVLVVLNTDGALKKSTKVTIHAPFYEKQPHPVLSYLYRSDWSDAQLKGTATVSQTEPVTINNGRASIRIELPPAGMAILA